MAKNKFSVTLPTGRVFNFASDSHIYTHVIARTIETGRKDATGFFVVEKIEDKAIYRSRSHAAVTKEYQRVVKYSGLNDEETKRFTFVILEVTHLNPAAPVAAPAPAPLPTATREIVKLTPPARKSTAPIAQSTLKPDELAVLEFIERGWYKCLNERFAANYCSFFLNHGLIEFTGGRTPDGREDVRVSDTGIVVLDLLDPDRTSKQN